MNDSDVYSISSNPNHTQATKGSVTIDGKTGEWTYVPDANEHGDDSFTIIITDDQGDSSNQSINIEINPIDDPSQINKDSNLSGNVLEDETVRGSISAKDIEGLTNNAVFSIKMMAAHKMALQRLIQPLESGR